MPGDWRSRLWETRVTSVRARAFDTDVSVLGVVSSPTHGRAEHLGRPESARTAAATAEPHSAPSCGMVLVTVHSDAELPLSYVQAA